MDRNAPVPVLAAEARLADVPIYFGGVGTAKARNVVVVKPQVDGRIMSIDFKEGQDVKRGDVLARIDSAIYQAQLDQAVAKKALDDVQLTNARRDLDRYTKLGGNIVAEKTIDTQRALVGQLEAQIKQDDAAIANARTMLGYTTIVAPINGRTGIRMVDEGNLVRASDVGIVMITEVKPISVLFTLPQQQLAAVNKALESGPVAVEAFDTDNKVALDRGTLQVVDNQVDSTTGTVRMKADFPNVNMQLWPGQFVNVRVLIETLNQVVVIPTPAVQRGPNGAFAYVVAGRGCRRLAHYYRQAADRYRGRHRSRASSRRSASSRPALRASRTAAGGGFRAAATRRRRKQPTVRRGPMPPACADTASTAPAERGRERKQGEGTAPSRLSDHRAASGARSAPAQQETAQGRKRETMSVSEPVHPSADRHVSARPCGAAGRNSGLLVAARLVAAAGRFSRPSR